MKAYITQIMNVIYGMTRQIIGFETNCATQGFFFLDRGDLFLEEKGGGEVGTDVKS